MTEETNSKPKRPRPEEESQEIEADTKKQKPSYKEILTILDDDDEDLSSLISAVDREISSSDESQPPAVNEQTPVEFDPSLLMRHLLEASDDELGIPTSAAGDSGEVAVAAEDDGTGDWFGGGDGLWEIDDEAANYYALLQSQLFM